MEELEAVLRARAAARRVRELYTGEFGVPATAENESVNLVVMKDEIFQALEEAARQQTTATLSAQQAAASTFSDFADEPTSRAPSRVRFHSESNRATPIPQLHLDTPELQGEAAAGPERQMRSSATLPSPRTGYNPTSARAVIDTVNVAQVAADVEPAQDRPPLDEGDEEQAGASDSGNNSPSRGPLRRSHSATLCRSDTAELKLMTQGHQLSPAEFAARGFSKDLIDRDKFKAKTYTVEPMWDPVTNKTKRMAKPDIFRLSAAERARRQKEATDVAEAKKNQLAQINAAAKAAEEAARAEKERLKRTPQYDGFGVMIKESPEVKPRYLDWLPSHRAAEKLAQQVAALKAAGRPLSALATVYGGASRPQSAAHTQSHTHTSGLGAGSMAGGTDLPYSAAYGLSGHAYPPQQRGILRPHSAFTGAGGGMGSTFGASATPSRPSTGTAAHARPTSAMPSSAGGRSSQLPPSRFPGHQHTDLSDFILEEGGPGYQEDDDEGGEEWDQSFGAGVGAYGGAFGSQRVGPCSAVRMPERPEGITDGHYRQLARQQMKWMREAEPIQHLTWKAPVPAPTRSRPQSAMPSYNAASSSAYGTSSTSRPSSSHPMRASTGSVTAAGRPASGMSASAGAGGLLDTRPASARPVSARPLSGRSGSGIGGGSAAAAAALAAAASPYSRIEVELLPRASEGGDTKSHKSEEDSDDEEADAAVSRQKKQQQQQQQQQAGAANKHFTVADASQLYSAMVTAYS